MVDDNNNFLPNITVSDKALFSLNSEVNSSNFMLVMAKVNLNVTYIDLHKSGIK